MAPRARGSGQHDHGLLMSTDEITQERIARNDARFREANEGIEATAAVYRVEHPVPFICECADAGCTAIIRMPLAQYEEVRADSRHFLNTPGHQVAALGTVEVVAEREGYVIVEKQGYAGEVAERLDKRRETRLDEAASE
jgi:hypothetical protein